MLWQKEYQGNLETSHIKDAIKINNYIYGKKKFVAFYKISNIVIIDSASFVGLENSLSLFHLLLLSFLLFNGIKPVAQ